MKRNLLIITLLFLGSFVILLLGNIIIIGEKIASLSQVAWAEYAFYTLILVVFYAVVIRPVVRVHRAPGFRLCLLMGSGILHNLLRLDINWRITAIIYLKISPVPS